MKILFNTEDGKYLGDTIVSDDSYPPAIVDFVIFDQAAGNRVQAEVKQRAFAYSHSECELILGVALS